MDREAARQFADRWTAEVTERDGRHWASVYQREGSEALVRAAAALRAHMKSVRPDWPTALDRSEDLAAHLAMRAIFDKVYRALRSQ